MEVRVYITFLTTFGRGGSAKDIKVRYLVVNTFSSYNIIIDKPTLNSFEIVLSTLYLTIKYPMYNGRVDVIRGDQEGERRCY